MRFWYLVPLVMSSLAWAQPKPQLPVDPNEHRRVFELPAFDAAVYKRMIDEKSDQLLILVILRGYSPPEGYLAWDNADVQDRIKDKARVMLVDQQRSDHRKAVWRLVPGLPKGVYAIRAGVLLDQEVPLTTSDEVKAWLEYLEKPEGDSDYVLRRVGERSDTCKIEPHLVFARRLERAGKTEAAAEEYTWILEQLYTGEGEYVKSGVALQRRVEIYEINQYHYEDRLRDLAPKFPSLVERIIRLRDEVRERAEADGKANEWAGKWVSLSGYAPDTERLFAYYDRIRKDPEQREWAGRFFDRMIGHVIESGSWRELGSRLEGPVDLVTTRFELVEMVNGFTDGPKPLEEAEPGLYLMIFADAMGTSAVVYASLLAADRDVDASQVAEAILGKCTGAASGAAKAMMVTFALQAGEARDMHLQWAKDAAAGARAQSRAAKLVADVEDALAKRETPK